LSKICETGSHTEAENGLQGAKLDKALPLTYENRLDRTNLVGDTSGINSWVSLMHQRKTGSPRQRNSVFVLVVPQK